jgi:hypothetical protein
MNMDRQSQVRRSSGAKAIALDSRKIIARYQLLKFQFLAALAAAGLAVGLHLIFGR